MGTLYYELDYLCFERLEHRIVHEVLKDMNTKKEDRMVLRLRVLHMPTVLQMLGVDVNAVSARRSRVMWRRSSGAPGILAK